MPGASAAPRPGSLRPPSLRRRRPTSSGSRLSSAEGFPMERVIIFDTTLRDGEQAAGAMLNPQEKLDIARQLDALGVDVIEAGFPISSAGDLEAVRLISREGRRAVICALAPAQRDAIDQAWQ